MYPKIEWRILKAMHGKTRSEDNPEFEMRRAAIHAATSANASHAFVTWRRASWPRQTYLRFRSSSTLKPRRDAVAKSCTVQAGTCSTTM